MNPKQGKPCLRQMPPLALRFAETARDDTQEASGSCEQSRKRPKPTKADFGLLVGVSGFEPEASWTRTKRDTKLRHTPITRSIIVKFLFLVKCMTGFSYNREIVRILYQEERK